MTATTETRGNRKTRSGEVVRDAMDKTIIVRVTRRVRHPLYGKEIRRFKNFHVHDENNDANVGDTVTIAEIRPISKTKRWRLVEVIKKATL